MDSIPILITFFPVWSAALAELSAALQRGRQSVPSAAK